MKGIILAGGAGTRLYPLTMVSSKQLLPVYDKPMIFYPLSTLMLAGIRDVLIISTPQDMPKFEELLGSGKQIGMSLQYAVQPSPDGLAQAFIIGESFVGDDTCAMVLGDNIFYGNGIGHKLKEAVNNAESGIATIFGYYVEDPEGKAISIDEKPLEPKSNYAVTGLYFYPQGVAELASLVQPSERGELEITTLNQLYLQQEKLKVSLLSRGYTWFDTGTMDSLMDASMFIKTIEEYQGMSIAALEEIAYRYGWIDMEALVKATEMYGKSNYGKHLKAVASGRVLG